MSRNRAGFAHSKNMTYLSEIIVMRTFFNRGRLFLTLSMYKKGGIHFSLLKIFWVVCLAPALQ